MLNETGGVPSGASEPGSEPGPSLDACIEAILLVVDEPVAEVVLAQVLERPRDEVSRALRELAASYDAQRRGYDLRQVAGGWRFYTREECAPVVERFVRDGQEVRLTQAALETLAVVAYRQPVSRSRVSAVRGVNCDAVMRTLTLRGLVEEAGTERETGAILYRTTGYFLERLGLASLEELPELAPFLPDEIDDAADQVGEAPGNVEEGAPPPGAAMDHTGEAPGQAGEITDGTGEAPGQAAEAPERIEEARDPGDDQGS
jgi:segregation and condensation protein B